MTILSVVFLLACWQGIAMYIGKPALFPTIPVLIKTLGELLASGRFYLAVGTTIGRGVAGMLLSLGAAVLLSGLFTRFDWLRELFRPLLTVMRSVPVVSFILLALIFLHTESIPLLIGFLTMFPLLTENLTKGLGSLRPGLSQVGRQFRIDRWNRGTLILYPQIKPFLYSGLASAVGFGWRAVIMGEVLALCAHGIGSEMKRAQSFLAVPELIAWTVVAVLISYLSDRWIGWLAERRFSVRFAKKGKQQLLTTAENNAPLARDIRLEHAGYRYGITDYSYTFDAGKIYGVSAPSGAGKTTLLNLINGTLLPVRGTVVADRSGGISFVFQEIELLSELSVLDNVALPLARLLTKEEAHTKALWMLREVELESVADRYPGELSYGQQQRVSIVRALVFDVPCLLMDEPFKGIDEAVTARIISLIRHRQQETGQTILFTSHNPEELKQLADNVVYLPYKS